MHQVLVFIKATLFADILFLFVSEISVHIGKLLFEFAAFFDILLLGSERSFFNSPFFSDFTVRVGKVRVSLHFRTEPSLSNQKVQLSSALIGFSNAKFVFSNVHVSFQTRTSVLKRTGWF